jgi:hypothetical protein
MPSTARWTGFESQLGTDFLGRFALTGMLLPKISQRTGALPTLYAATMPAVRGGQYYGGVLPS